MKLLPLDQHCARLTEVIMDVAHWVDVCEWLRLGAAIEKVEVNTAKHDLSSFMCNDYGYGEAQDVLLRQFVEDFSVFSMVWGALEAALDIMRLPRHPDKSQRGKISDACFHLNLKFRKRSVCLGLREEVQAFRDTAQRCLGFDRVQSRYVLGRAFGEAGVGLYIVYELRNQFAHGSMVFPRPDEQNRPISPHQSLVRHATRITLYQIQMLVSCHLEHCDEMGDYHWYGEDEVPLSTAVLAFHLEEVDNGPRLL